MIPASFDYVRPGTLEEALAILRDREGEAKVLAGGYSLIPLLKLRLAQPALLVDIQASTASTASPAPTTGGGSAAGRRTARSCSRRAGHGAIRDAASGIGDPQVRNWGTIGGSCAHADPSSDWPAVLHRDAGRRRRAAALAASG